MKEQQVACAFQGSNQSAYAVSPAKYHTLTATLINKRAKSVLSKTKCTLWI